MSMTQAMDEILAVVEQIVADHTSYLLEVDSGLGGVELVNRTTPYLKLQVKFLPADQVELGAPTVKQWGQIWMQIAVKEGDGWKAALELIDFVRPYFNCKRLGAVLCLAAGSMPMKEKDGFECWPIIVNFYYHTRG